MEHAEARISGVGGNPFVEIQVSIIEGILQETNRLHMGGGEFIDADRLLVEVAGVKELNPKGKFIPGPQRLIMPKMNSPVFVIIQR